MTGLFDTVTARLRIGPATALSLARWCNLRTPFMERMLEAWRRERRIRKVVNRYALPFNPLSPAHKVIVGRGYRWGVGLIVEIEAALWPIAPRAWGSHF